MTSNNLKKFSASFVGLWFLILVIKLIFGALTPPLYDEAYYWLWSQRPALAYFDHPGGIAWGLSVTSLISDQQFNRFFLIFVAHLAWLMFFYLLKDFYSEKKLSLFLLFLFLHPLTFWSSIFVTPDLLLQVFWILGLGLGLRTLLQCYQGRSPFINLFVLGLIGGLGLNCKLHFIFFIFALFISSVFLAAREKISFKIIFKCSFVFFTGLILSVWPVFLWNYWHDFVSFKFQIQRGLSRPDWEAEWTLNYLCVVFFAFPLFWKFIFFNKKFNAGKVFVLSTLLIPITFFLFSSFKGPVEGNWISMAVVSFFALVLFLEKPVSKVFWYLASMSLIIFSLVFWNSVTPLEWSFLAKLNEARETKKFLPYIPDDAPLYTCSYQISSSLALWTHKDVFTFPACSRPSQFNLWANEIPARFYFLVPEDLDLSEKIGADFFADLKYQLPNSFKLWEIRR